MSERFNPVRQIGQLAEKHQELIRERKFDRNKDVVLGTISEGLASVDQFLWHKPLVAGILALIGLYFYGSVLKRGKEIKRMQREGLLYPNPHIDL